jgi:hypothetical protein
MFQELPEIKMRVPERSVIRHGTIDLLAHFLACLRIVMSQSRHYGSYSLELVFISCSIHLFLFPWSSIITFSPDLAAPSL